jgi:hypothetical protein
MLVRLANGIGVGGRYDSVSFIEHPNGSDRRAVSLDAARRDRVVRYLESPAAREADGEQGVRTTTGAERFLRTPSRGWDATAHATRSVPGAVETSSAPGSARLLERDLSWRKHIWLLVRS